MNWPETSEMTVNIVDSLAYYTFCKFNELDFLTHGFSTRLGGVSTGCFESMNLSFSRGDAREAVSENFARICTAMGSDSSNTVLSAQTHKTELYNVTAADRGRGVTRELGYSDIDGLLTDESGVLLCTQYADCVPLFFADPVRRVVATSHAGWKGTAARIGAKTVERMRKDYGCATENIICGIGPSIGKCCFEVEEDVAGVFSAMEEGVPCVREAGKGKFHVDLWEINSRILISAGVVPENIAVSGLCTRCRPDIFWSHRAEGNARGSLAAFIGIV